MKNDQLPPPPFSSWRYARPNSDWVCGRAADGRPCRQGPDSSGHCKADFECRPRLETKPGETKGRHVCTRPAQYGGPCAPGPTPIGACGKPIPKCQPRMSVRKLRGTVTGFLALLTFGAGVVLFTGDHRWRIANPGPLSPAHSGAAFASTLRTNTVSQVGCENCHSAASSDLAGWAHHALSASPGPFEWAGQSSLNLDTLRPLDAACQTCHNDLSKREREYSFHQPNVTHPPSCSGCHVEHQGSSGLLPVSDDRCRSCHSSPEIMARARGIGTALPPAAFDQRKTKGQNRFHSPRPDEGFTRIIHAFAEDHPEFQIHSRRLPDPTPLRFNHKRHFAPDIPRLNGKSLSCVDCHEADSSGAYHLPVSFEQHCSQCHSLQFDARTPDFFLPHGDSDRVLSFLQNLEWEYGAYAGASEGIVQKREVDAFTRRKLDGLKEQYGSLEALSRQIFEGHPDTGAGDRRALFKGCAYCHQIERDALRRPSVAPVRIPDRWLTRSEFDHATHHMVSCQSCHGAEASEKTSDVLMPVKADCAQCHGPRGGVSQSCSLCHRYHSHINR